MKDDKEKSSPNQPDAKGVNPSNADIAWFDQFSDKPGIYDVYTRKELDTLMNNMLTDIKNKINEID